MGSGLNLPHYDPQRVELVWGLEPSAGMRRKARHHAAGAPFEVRWLNLPGEEIPLEDDSADTVVLTYTLCTIPDWHRALEQMQRVLKPSGQLLFCEHGTAPDEGVRGGRTASTPCGARWRGAASSTATYPSSSSTLASVSSEWRRAIYRKFRGSLASISGEPLFPCDRALM